MLTRFQEPLERYPFRKHFLLSSGERRHLWILILPCSVPPNCEARNVKKEDELNRNRMYFELQKVMELENDCKRVKRVVWAADGMAFDWKLDRESGTYRAYWPAAAADRTDEWIKGLVRRCSALDPGREILKVVPRDNVCEVKWRKGPIRVADPSPSASFSARHVSNSVMARVFPSCLLRLITTLAESIRCDAFLGIHQKLQAYTVILVIAYNRCFACNLCDACAASAKQSRISRRERRLLRG